MTVRAYCEHVHRMRNVPHLVLALVDKRGCYLATHRTLNRVGNCDPASLGQRLQARSSVHAIAIDGAIALPNDITKMDTDAKVHLPTVGSRPLGCQQITLNRKRCSYGTNGSLEDGKH